MHGLKKVLFVFLFALTTPSFAADSPFFANESVQRRHPEAFVLQPEAQSFVRNLEDETRLLRDALVAAIAGDPTLREALKTWETLSFDEQLPHLRRIFDLEVRLMGITAPELIFDAQRIPGRAAYFDFDLKSPGAGKVILNPDVLAKMEKSAALALLIHETRHSAQLQLAFSPAWASSPAARSYRAAFTAQTTDIRSFCDFLTLANEFEAFQFGNYVLGRLSDWILDLTDMGTFASQYDATGKLKLDLNQLRDNGDPRSLLEKFNEAETEQCQLLGYCR
ncbi:MAG: hypothetical protein KF767_08360 [Bdellovibrionaceae bacterium]|nr:hypothetical protein [Pseudobdellovibrionaceae bacterium]